MPFDPSSAQPISSGFDPLSARPAGGGFDPASAQPEHQRSVGEEFTSHVGLGVRNVMRGAASIPDMMINGPVNSIINAVSQGTLSPHGGLSTTPNQDMMDQIADRMHLMRPENVKDRLVGAGIEGATGGLMTSAGGLATQGVKGATGVIGKALASSPLFDTASGATSGLSQQGAAELGADPLTQMAAGLAGGLIPSGVHVAAHVTGHTVAGAPKFIQDMFDNRGVDTTPMPDPRESPLANRGMSPQQQEEYHHVLTHGTADDINNFYANSKIPTPDPAKVSRWVTYRDGVPEGYADPSFHPATEDQVNVGAHNQNLQDHIDQQTAGWKNKPDIELINHVDDIQDPAVREQARKEGAQENAIGFLGTDGKIRMFANRIHTPEQANAVLYHEALGHYGLQEQFGAGLDKTLETLAARNVGSFGTDVKAWMKKNPGAYNGSIARAADEVLAERSSTGPLKPVLMDAIESHIRRFGRQMGLNLKYNDAEVSHILAMAHDAVINGKGRNVIANQFRGSRNKFMYGGKKATGFDPESATAFTAPDGHDRFEFNDRDSMLIKHVNEHDEGKLSEFLHHPNLFKQYPQLKDVNVKGVYTNGKMNGFYSPNSKTIGIDPFGPDQHSTVLHEVQHAIQHIEGHSNGSLVRSADGKINKDVYRRSLGEIEARDTQARQRLRTADRIEIPPYSSQGVYPDEIIVTPPASNKFMRKDQFNFDDPNYKGDPEYQAHLREHIDKVNSFIEDNREDITELQSLLSGRGSHEQEVRDAQFKRIGEIGGRLDAEIKSRFPNINRQEKRLLLNGINKGPYALENYLDRLYNHVDQTGNRYMRKPKEREPNEPLALYRGDPVIQDAPQARSHPGVFFYGAEDKDYAKGFSRAIQDGSMVGGVRKVLLPAEHANRLADLADDATYNKLLPNKSDRSGRLTRGVMPDEKLTQALRDHGYSGYKWKSPASTGTEHFILPEVLKDLKYEPGTFENKYITRAQMEEATSGEYVAKEIDTIYRAMDQDYTPTVKTRAQTIEDAHTLGFSPSQIKALGNTPELAVRSARMTASLNTMDMRLNAVRDKIRNNEYTPKDLDEARQIIADQMTIGAKIRDERAEYARALAISKLGYTRKNLESFGKLLEEQGGTLGPLGNDDTLLRFLKKLDEMHEEGNTNGTAVLMKSLGKPNWEDYITTLHQNFMLSGVSTHFKAPLDMSIGIGRELFEAAGALPISLGKEALRSIGVDVKPGIHPTEVAARLSGIVRAFTEAETYRNAARTFMENGVNPNGFGGKNNARIPGISKVTDLISAQDAFFRAFATNMHLYGLGTRQAVEEARAAGGKINWDDIMSQGASYARTPSEELLKAAKLDADKTLLLNKNKLTAGLDRIKNVGPDASGMQRVGAFIANFLTPFVRVESNSLVNRIIRRSPLAFIDKETRMDLKAGGARADLAMSRILYGTAGIASYWMAAGQGKTTGNGPDNPAKKAEMMAAGWRPQAVHENGQYNTGDKLGMSINPFDVHNQTATMVASMREAFSKDKNEGSLAIGLKMAMYSMMKSMTEMSWINDIAPAVEAATAPDATLGQKADRFAGEELATMWPNIIGQSTRIADQAQPDISEKPFLGPIESSIPGVRQSLPVKMTPYGDPVQGGASLLGTHSWLPQDNRITGGNHVDETTDPAEKEMARLGSLMTGGKALVTKANQHITVEDASGFDPKQVTPKDSGSFGIKLTSRQYSEYQHLVGQNIVEHVRQEMNSPEWQKMTDEEKAEEVKSISDDMKKEVKEHLYGS